MQHQPPVTGLIAAALQHQRAIGGQHAGGLTLFGQQAGDVGDRVVRQPAGLQPLPQPGRHASFGNTGIQRTDEGTHRLAQFGRAAYALTAPERQARRTPRCGSHHDLVMGDLLDPPRGGAQGDDIVDP
jgi:hypothetical protein